MTERLRHKLILPLGTTRIMIADLPGQTAVALLPRSSTDFSETRQINIIKRHKVAIEKASVSGELIGRDPYTNVEQPYAIGDRLRELVLLTEEVATYLSRYSIEVVVAQPPEVTGRYTLEKAANTIAQLTNEVEDGIYESLKRAVLEGDLLVYRPNSKVPYQPKIFRDFLEELYWDELNQWLKTSLPRLDWRFPEPLNKSDKVSTDKPQKNKAALRVEEIGKAAKKMFDNPLNIPYGGKKHLGKNLCELHPELFTESTFLKAWTDAKKEKLVEVENVEIYKSGK